MWLSLGNVGTRADFIYSLSIYSARAWSESPDPKKEEEMNNPIANVGDTAAVATVVCAVSNILPHAAAALAIIWALIRIIDYILVRLGYIKGAGE